MADALLSGEIGSSCANATIVRSDWEIRLGDCLVLLFGWLTGYCCLTDQATDRLTGGWSASFSISLLLSSHTQCPASVSDHELVKGRLTK